MPTYEYECAACAQRFEVWQAMIDHPLRKCAHCGRMRARRLIGAGSGLIFKGSGFYGTDYRKPHKEHPPAGETPEKPASPPTVVKEGPAGRPTTGELVQRESRIAGQPVGRHAAGGPTGRGAATTGGSRGPSVKAKGAGTIAQKA